ncbi:MAG TPA: hypothetical protein VFA29_01430 [Candidatus Baltobacteraceae bacterium]|nr:hypothetical protein [Candidatus Baltobacteraceae bacterium]
MERRRPAALPALLCALELGAAPPTRCTREELKVHGLAVSAVYCVVPADTAREGHDLAVSVDETFSSVRGAFTRQSRLHFLAGEDASRVIEDVPLARLGLEGTLHTTLVLRRGAVRMEGAMLTPGAITVK